MEFSGLLSLVRNLADRGEITLRQSDRGYVDVHYSDRAVSEVHNLIGSQLNSIHRRRSWVYDMLMTLPNGARMDNDQVVCLITDSAFNQNAIRTLAMEAARKLLQDEYEDVLYHYLLRKESAQEEATADDSC